MRTSAISRRSGIILMYAILTIYIVNLLIKASNFSDPRAQTFPLIFGIPTFILLTLISIVHIIPYMTGKERINHNMVNEDFYEFNNEERGKLNPMTFAIFISFPLFAYLFGFLVSVPIYTGLFARITTKSTKKSVLVAVCVTALWYLLFVQGLSVVFHEGIITGMLLLI